MNKIQEHFLNLDQHCLIIFDNFWQKNSSSIITLLNTMQPHLLSIYVHFDNLFFFLFLGEKPLTVGNQLFQLWEQSVQENQLESVWMSMFFNLIY